MKRGHSSGPEPLADVLGRLFTARGWGRKSDRLRLEQAWSQGAGPKLAAQTRVGAFRRGVLEILVGNATLMQELAGFHKKRLLDALRQLLPGVTLLDLRFRAGTIDSGGPQ
jgi:predicted nucleic acid-binding Zn ribbon protein